MRTWEGKLFISCVKKIGTRPHVVQVAPGITGVQYEKQSSHSSKTEAPEDHVMVKLPGWDALVVSNSFNESITARGREQQTLFAEEQLTIRNVNEKKRSTVLGRRARGGDKGV